MLYRQDTLTTGSQQVEQKQPNRWLTRKSPMTNPLNLFMVVNTIMFILKATFKAFNISDGDDQSHIAHVS